MDRPAHRIKRQSLTPPAQPPSVPSAAGEGGGYPPWVILRHYGEHEGEEKDLTPDAKTAAASRTSTGLHITVSFSLAAPPAPSLMWFRFPCVVDSETSCLCSVIAAHGDSVLINISYASSPYRNVNDDHFVYRASAAAGDRSRPPMLSMLPPSPDKYTEFLNAIGILRRGEDDLVVAQLTVERQHDTRLEEAKLLVFRSGEWSVKRTPISHGSGGSSRGHKLSAPWETDMVVPVGDRLLCYIDLHHGVIIFSDVFGDHNPSLLRLRYVPFPVEPPVKSFQDEDDDSRERPNVSRTVGVTGDGAGAALKFVDISPRCCCGGGLNKYTTCDRSSGAFVIRTWTLRIGHDGRDGDDMAWEMDAMVDATELWSLDACTGLAFVRPEYPVVSMDDDSHLICVAVTGEHQKGGRTYAERNSSLIKVDTRRKTIRSVPPFLQRPRHSSKTLLSRFSSYFNPNQNSNNGAGGASPTKIHAAIEPPPPVAVATAEPRTNGIITCNSSAELKIPSPGEIFVAIEGIPDMAREDVLKAYTILSHDNGRWFRSLLGLPMSLRKDWLLMMIKSSEACIICSACTMG